ncbi:chromosome partitioning protein [Actinotalea sp. K2]|uniref:chromosome partitioning protein n=1 Tax=Actinotalea sp. K2 TaxID=2939438 RepID=UPI002017C8E7|nr:chromosome partitioning protein [Actinotalea sp. K2]MCL3861423.1 chromosome partitioning protein [Actinotalea sp. K2]
MDEQEVGGVPDGDDPPRPPTRRELRQQRAAQDVADAYAEEPWDRTIERPARMRVPVPDDATSDLTPPQGVPVHDDAHDDAAHDEAHDEAHEDAAHDEAHEDAAHDEAHEDAAHDDPASTFRHDGHGPLPEPPPVPEPPRVLPVAPVSVRVGVDGAASPTGASTPVPPVLPAEPDEDDVPESPPVVARPVAGPRASSTPWAPTSRAGAGEGAPYRWTEPASPFRGLDARVGEPTPEELPTLTDLLSSRPEPATGPAEHGWQATVRRLTGGLVAPPPGAAEVRRRTAVATVQRSLDGPRTIVVLNPKGGAHKTTASLLIAATFGIHRGGYTLAWDNNETRGTLGWRSHQARHHNTAVNLLQDLDRFSDPGSARVGDLDNYVRAQGSAQFDVLASDEDAASAASIDAEAFTALHGTLARFYRVMVIDTGNNMRASNWQAAVEAADQLVIVSTVREDTSQSAAWAVDALRAMGHGEAVSRAVTVLSAPAPRVDHTLTARLHEHFGRLTRTVQDVPYDPALVAGGPLDVEALAPSTREAWLHVTAAVAEGL